MALAKIDGQVSQLLTRILDTTVPSVIGAYEEKVRKLESDKLLMMEMLATAGKPASSFSTTHLEPPSHSWQTLGFYGVQSGWRIAARC